MPFSGLQSLMIEIGHGGPEMVSNLDKDPNDNRVFDNRTVSQEKIKFHRSKCHFPGYKPNI